jgi:hypothetical protein
MLFGYIIKTIDIKGNVQASSGLVILGNSYLRYITNNYK